MTAPAGASTSPAPGTNRAGPRRSRGEGALEQPTEQWVLPASEAADPAQALVCALPSQADPDPPAPSPVPYTGRPVDAPRPRRSPAQAEARAVPVPGRHATFQCPICSLGSSPGSRVHSSRGAVREMQLRFLRTLLRMVPTPPPLPPPPPPCRFRHLPPRRREPVSLSCRIRERPELQCSHRPPGSPPAPLASCEWLRESGQLRVPPEQRECDWRSGVERTWGQRGSRRSQGGRWASAVRSLHS